MAATTEETFPRVGALGLPVFVGLRGMDIPELKVHLQSYRKAWQEAGHAGNGDVFLRLPVYVGETERGAREEPYESIMYYFARQANLTRSAVGRDGTGSAERRLERAERLQSLSYEQILHTKVVFGTAVELIDRLSQLREELGLEGIVAELDAGGLIPAERVQRSLRLLTQEVMPAFK
jgi:hypothetical protein